MILHKTDPHRLQKHIEQTVHGYEQITEQLQCTAVQYRGRPEAPVDTTVVTTAPLYHQLLHLVAEENAIIDTVYCLSRALNKGLVDLDAFQKVRAMVPCFFLYDCFVYLLSS